MRFSPSNNERVMRFSPSNNDPVDNL